jgi:hypothetical protein
MYRKHFFHYRDNLYFLHRHFDGPRLKRYVWDAYRTYVGLSRWPWRLAAKNGAFLAAWLQASRSARRRRKNPCRMPE